MDRVNVYVYICAEEKLIFIVQFKTSSADMYDSLLDSVATHGHPIG